MFVVALFLATVAVPLTLQGSFAENVDGKSQTLKGEHIGNANVFDLQCGGVRISKGKNEKNEEQIVIERYGYFENVMPVYLPKGTTIVVYSGDADGSDWNLSPDPAEHGIEVEPNVGEVNMQFGTNHSTKITTSGNECPFKIGAGNNVKVTTKDSVIIKSENAPGIYSEGELNLNLEDEAFSVTSQKSNAIEATSKVNVTGVEASTDYLYLESPNGHCIKGTDLKVTNTRPDFFYNSDSAKSAVKLSGSMEISGRYCEGATIRSSGKNATEKVYGIECASLSIKFENGSPQKPINIYGTDSAVKIENKRNIDIPFSAVYYVLNTKSSDPEQPADLVQNGNSKQDLINTLFDNDGKSKNNFWRILTQSHMP